MTNNSFASDNLSISIDPESEEQLLLFKYLDIKGAASMLANSDIQFTNATRLNDPFDCHPGLIDFSQIPPERAKWGQENTILLDSDPYRRNREEAWVCCLSKVHNSILMWSYYNGHKGVCIGLDIEKVKEHIHYMLGTMVDNSCYDVEYRDIIEKPDYYKNEVDFFYYQMITKAKDWAHEREVRMFIFGPHQLCLPYEPEDKNKVIDWKEVRAYPKISGDCFSAIYLGVNISKEHKNEITKIARHRNPNIKIYQMRVNPEAFKLDSEEG